MSRRVGRIGILVFIFFFLGLGVGICLYDELVASSCR